MRTITLKKTNMVFRDKHILGFFEKTISEFGNGAKIDAPKEHIGRKVYVVVVDA